MRNLILLACVGFFLSGCATLNVPFTGESNADERLKGDTLSIVRVFVRGAGCNSIDHVDSEVLFYEPSNGALGHVWGKEGWVVTGCSRPFSFHIAFMEDGRGGSFSAVSRR